MSIASNIKTLRNIYKLSQKELAIIAGVTDKAVSSWEVGAKEPRMGNIQKIADHFGLPKSAIIENNGISKSLQDKYGTEKDFLTGEYMMEMSNEPTFPTNDFTDKNDVALTRMTIASNIRTMREIYKLSQKELALIAGVTDKAVSSWEVGAKAPRMGNIQKIADHFGLQKSAIIEVDGIAKSFQSKYGKERNPTTGDYTVTIQPVYPTKKPI